MSTPPLYRCPFCHAVMEDNIDSLIAHRQDACEERQRANEETKA